MSNKSVKLFQVGLGTFGVSSLAIWHQFGLSSQGRNLKVVGLANRTQKSYTDLTSMFSRATVDPKQLPESWYTKIPIHSGDQDHLIQAMAESPADAVFICTPDWLHYEYTKAALKAGKHVKTASAGL